MSQNKLKRYSEIREFDNVLEFEQSKENQGVWAKKIFKNTNPIVLELGCGKGELTLALAQKYKNKNFIGVDIKGNRIWKGAKYALENNIQNAFFLRFQIDHIEWVFAKNEVSEIWFTFPDPQLRESKENKRLTSQKFINLYKKVLTPDASLNLKTDSTELYQYTKEVLQTQGYPTKIDIENIYATSVDKNLDVLAFKTYYEEQFLKANKTIKYLQWKI